MQKIHIGRIHCLVSLFSFFYIFSLLFFLFFSSSYLRTRQKKYVSAFSKHTLVSGIITESCGSNVMVIRKEEYLEVRKQIPQTAFRVIVVKGYRKEKCMSKGVNGLAIYERY